jgi:glyoxylase-like metal-dependent hydrolase (beta-lactamase superfamily II)
VVDFGNGVGALRPCIDPFTDGRSVVAVATHGHFDHVGGLHEFDDRRVHEDDAEMTRSPYPLRLRRPEFAEGTEEMFEYYGYPVPELLIRGLPERDFDVAGWVAPGAEPTVLLHEGDMIDLGDRSFEVLHTPGHTAGSACLWEVETGTLFSGDAIYVDAKLSWDDASAFTASLQRLAELPAQRVFAGHERWFNGDELRATVEGALRDLGPDAGGGSDEGGG